MSGKKSRNKGKAGERELAKLLRSFGFETRRGQQYCGANGDADVIGLPNIHIECKRNEGLRLYERGQITANERYKRITIFSVAAACNESEND